MTKRFGFTLAEVLITLGIIGVVAALTMPTLINSTRGMQNRVAFKKALSVLSQAVTLNLALDDYDFNTSTLDTANTTDASIYNIIKNRMNVVRVSTEGLGYDLTVVNSTLSPANMANQGTDDVPAAKYVSASGQNAFFMADGMALVMPASTCQCRMSGIDDTSNACVAIIDVNGAKGPNTQVTCIKNADTTDDSCTVDNPSDIYPIYLGNSTVLPATEAGRAVLYGK